MVFHNSRCYPLQVVSVYIHKVLPMTSSIFQFIFSAIYLTKCIKFVPCADSTRCTVSTIL